jgi:starch-binding outer membrane protein, SusD/RagB family
MKQRIYRIVLLSLAITIASCESILEVEPKNQILSETALSTANDYQAVIISAYDRIQAFSYWGRDMALMGEALADVIYVETAISGQRYNAHNTNNTNAHFGIWGQYGTINDLNNVIATIEERLTAPADVVRVPALLGEALFLRAMVYFDLARVYGYEPTRVPSTGLGAGFDKSVVLRLSPTFTKDDATKMTRATNTEVYQAIEADLLEATSLLTVETSASGRLRANKGAAHALLGKVYLYWERYADAVTQFDLAMANTTATPITAGQYAGTFRGTQPNKEAFLQLKFVQSTEMAGVVGVNDSPYSYTQPNGKNGLSTFGGSTPSPELRALFIAGDDRQQLFFQRCTGTNPAAGCTSYWWSDKFNGSDGQYTDGPIILRYSDVLLMKAEALAEQGQYPAAQTIVNTLRTNRNTTAIAPADATLIDFILQERMRELYFEGHRWFDLKRKGRNITKPAGKGTTIAYNDFRLLAPLPAGDVTFNPELPQNPGY